MSRTKIKEVLTLEPQGQTLVVKGWVRSIRASKNVAFITLNDGSTVKTLQIVLAEEFRNNSGCDSDTEYQDYLGRMKTGACLAITGKLVPSQGSGQKAEFMALELDIYGEADPETYPIQPKKHTLEFLREKAHLRIRTNTFSSVFRIRHAAAYAVHKFYNDLGFFYMHSPIITASDTEGAGEMFQVTTLDPLNIPKTDEGEVDYKQDFFGKPAYLTVSGQLNAELFALGLSEVYTFGPTFRAENSNTSRHLAEFWMIEPEMAFYDAKDNQDLAEKFLKYIIQHVMNTCPDDLAFLDEHIKKEEANLKAELRRPMSLLDTLNFVLENDFERVTYTEAIDILIRSKPYKKKKFKFPVSWGADLQSEHERYLVEKHFKKPVILVDYPKDIKAFYMKMNEDGKTVRAMDVLFPGIGEIIGGSQREESYEVLKGRIEELGLSEEDYWWYLDTRKFGTAPHSGFGLGFERMLLFLTGMSNIRDVIPFPRTPHNAEF